MKPAFRSIAYFSIFLTILSGFLFGYHIGLTGPFLLFTQDEFHLSVLAQSLISSFVILGALVGSLIAGPIADVIGRKKSLLGCSFLFLVASAITYFGNSSEVFCLGRFLAGIGVGAISLVSTMLLSEISPESIRGQIVSLNQLMITVGILVAFLEGYFVNKTHDWHFLIFVSAIPAAIQIGFSSFIPESPAWHKTRNLHEKAKITLQKLRKDLLWIEDMLVVEEKERGVTKAEKVTKITLWIGIFINFFQQITGINALIFFAPQIFNEAGFVGSSSSLLASISVGVINILGTVVAILLIERLGRRILLLVGCFLMAFSLGGLAYVFTNPSFAIFSLTFFLLFCFSFAISIGPVTWVLISEIFPARNKGKAMAICLFVNWCSAYIVTLFFLDLSRIIGSSGVFALFGGFSALAFLYTYKKIPETKGKSHTEIEKLLLKH